MAKTREADIKTRTPKNRFQGPLCNDAVIDYLYRSTNQINLPKYKDSKYLKQNPKELEKEIHNYI